ncbi:hypothetical protein H257_05412 [Aphanomyces astaci]|uniref:Uncharacterized protein n=1 Tax=Aphanomyces astaci TaxID=112090 RepID=W4GS54_APHAT|nr:hypothetical protein H257_05412 [Aphanomyces astaci]ETV81849.1 hypothetical protein H257_05412 [Aphanomyces astaci]|eukprot:XP_009828586.1 hypothetical protein H257_05412 [Aphanomyces astaci]
MGRDDHQKWLDAAKDEYNSLLSNGTKGTIWELREILSNEQSRYEQALFNEKRRQVDLEQSMQGQFMSVTQEHVLHRLEEARALVDANTALLRDEKVRLRQEKAAYESNIHRAYEELEPQSTQIQVERSVLDLQQQAHRLRNFFPEALGATSVPSCESSPSTCSTVPMDAHIPAPGSYPSTPRTSDLPLICGDPNDETKSGEAICGRCAIPVLPGTLIPARSVPGRTDIALAAVVRGTLYWNVGFPGRMFLVDKMPVILAGNLAILARDVR